MNTRSKSISPWNRVWEVLCPDCGEVRSRKDRPKRGILVSRCRPCAFTERERLRGRGRFRTWHWAIYGGIFNPEKSGPPCSLQRCADCGTMNLVTNSNLPKGLPYRCLSCGISHTFKCSVTGDARKASNASHVGVVYQHVSCAISRCACCGQIRVYGDRQRASRLYCFECYQRHKAICGARERVLPDMPEGYTTVMDYAKRMGLSRSAAYRRAERIGVKPGIRNRSSDALLMPI